MKHIVISIVLLSYGLNLFAGAKSGSGWSRAHELSIARSAQRNYQEEQLIEQLVEQRIRDESEPISPLGAQKDEPVGWSNEEMEELAKNEAVIKSLRDNGIEQFICNAMMADDEIETILDEIPMLEDSETHRLKRGAVRNTYFFYKNRKLRKIGSIGYIGTGQSHHTTWLPHTPDRLKIYLRRSLRHLSQVELLKKMAAAIKNNTTVNFTLKWSLPRQSVFDRLSYRNQFHQEVRDDDQRDIAKAYSLLPKPLKDVAWRFIRLENKSLIEHGSDWIKKKLDERRLPQETN